MPGETEFHRLTGEFPSYRSGGCEACNFTGYKGRLQIIESVEISPALRQAIVTGEQRVNELKRIAGGQRRSMAASAKDWIVSGKTTPTEVQYVLGISFWRELADGVRIQSRDTQCQPSAGRAAWATHEDSCPVKGKIAGRRVDERA